MWKWGAAALLCVTASFATEGLAFLCYARGRLALAATAGGRDSYPLAWAPGLWTEYGFMFAGLIVWMAAFIGLVFWTRGMRWAWIMLCAPAAVFVWFAWATLRIAYACTLF